MSTMALPEGIVTMRQSLNRNALLLAILLFSLLTAAVMGLMFLWQSRNNAVIHSGDAVENLCAARYYVLQDAVYDEASGRYYFEFKVDSLQESCQLVLMRARNFCMYRGEAVYADYNSEDYKRLRVMELDEGFYDDTAGTLRFEWKADSWFLTYNMFLVPKAETMEGMEGLYGTVQIFSVGMLALLLI